MRSRILAVGAVIALLTVACGNAGSDKSADKNADKSSSPSSSPSSEKSPGSG